MARTFEINRQHPQPRLIRQAAEILARGGIIAHPTDTTYALGVAMSNHKGIEELYRLKKKDLKRPLSFLCTDLANLSEYALISDLAFQTMRRILPGPYTIILPSRKSAPRNLLWTNRKEIGLRMPDDPVVRALVEQLGEPMISTSAKLPDCELLENAQDILRDFGRDIELILDAGFIYPEPSTILSFLDEEPKLVRMGKGPVEGIVDVEPTD